MQRFANLVKQYFIHSKEDTKCLKLIVTAFLKCRTVCGNMDCVTLTRSV